MASRAPILRLDRISAAKVPVRRGFEPQPLLPGHLVALSLVGADPLRREEIMTDLVRAAALTFGAPGQTTTVLRGFADNSLKLCLITDPASPSTRRDLIERIRSFILSEGLRPRMIRAIDFLAEDVIGPHPYRTPAHAVMMDTRQKATDHIAALRTVWAGELGAELTAEPGPHSQILFELHMATDPLTLRLLHGFLGQKRSPVRRQLVISGLSKLRGEYSPAEIAEVIAGLEANGWIERVVTSSTTGSFAYAGPMARRIQAADLLAL